MARLAFMYYFDWAEELLKLPDELRLKIDDAMKRFVLYGEEPSDPIVIYSMFGLMRRQAEEDMRVYQEKCEKNRNNIRQRYDRMQPNTNATNKNKENKTNITLREKESTKEKTQQVRFTPPTLDEVVEFITTNGYTFVNAEAFYNHYESIGWKVGRNPMKDWHAAVRGWNSRDKQTAQQVAPTPETPRKKDLPLV